MNMLYVMNHFNFFKHKKTPNSTMN